MYCEVCRRACAMRYTDMCVLCAVRYVYNFVRALELQGDEVVHGKTTFGIMSVRRYAMRHATSFILDMFCNHASICR